MDIVLKYSKLKLKVTLAATSVGSVLRNSYLVFDNPS